MLHPLVHENASTLREQRFSTRLTGEEFFLKDHQVQGQKVLPGVAYLEMARAAVEQATESENDSETLAMYFNQVVWARPIEVGDEPQAVHISLYPDDDKRIAYEIYTEGDSVKAEADSGNVVHSQGVAGFETLDQRPTLNLAELQSRISRRSQDTHQIYEAFKGLGIEYGPAHRAIEAVFMGKGEVLAKLALPSSVSTGQAEFGLHPSLLDAALQASISLNQEPLSRPALPFALDSLEYFGPCTERMWAWVRVQGDSSEHVQKLDIDY